MGSTPNEVLLDATAHLVVEDGFDAVSVSSIATRAGVTVGDVLAEFGSLEHLLVTMLNREYTLMWRDMVFEVERDPRGGLISSIYRYALSIVYARPLPRALFLSDPAGLNRIMRASHGLAYIPQTGIRASFIDKMKAAGMVRPEIDSERLAALLAAVSAGTAIASPHGPQIDLINEGLHALLVGAVDADVTDTTPGKTVFIEYATGLVTPREPE